MKTIVNVVFKVTERKSSVSEILVTLFLLEKKSTKQ